MIYFIPIQIQWFTKLKLKNFYKWVIENPDEFDASEMEGKYRNELNAGVFGKMKSEVGSKIITEFVALSPKSYSYKYRENEIKKAKGVSLSLSEKRCL